MANPMRLARATWTRIVEVATGGQFLAGQIFYDLTNARARVATSDNVTRGLAYDDEVVASDDPRLSDARTPSAHTHPWSQITSRPTTIAGYGITDAASPNIAVSFAFVADGTTTAFDLGQTIGAATQVLWFEDGIWQQPGVHFTTSGTVVTRTSAPEAGAKIYGILMGNAGTINVQTEAHTHTIAQVSGLQDALDAKAATGHGHAITDVTGLQTALDGKSATGHAHTIANVTGLQNALDSKAAINHSHAAATSTTSGAMSSTDKVKLDAVGTMANRALTISTSDPSGGADGDVWFKV